MRRFVMPLLALLLIAAAIAATRACSDDSAPTDGPASVEPIAEERIDRRRVTATAHAAPDVAVVDQSVTDESPPPDDPTEPLVQLVTRDEELALTRRFLSGIVVNGDDEPITGVNVELTSRWLPAEVARHAELPRNSLSGPTDYEWPPILPQMTSSVSTGSNGRFRLPYVVGDHLRIEVDSWRHRGPVERSHEEQRIVLAEADWRLEVHVVRSTNGEPVVGAPASLWQLGVGRKLGTTDSSGRAQFAVGLVGRATLNVDAEGLASLVDLPVDLAPAEPREIEVRLLPEYPVRGRVVDDETGRPIAGARVGSGVPRHWSEAPDEETDADGRFELRGLALQERTSSPIGAIADGYVPIAKWLPSELPPEGYREVELRLVRGGSVRLRCVDGSGVPVRNALVYAEGEVTRGGPDRADHLMDIGEGAEWTESDGVAVIADLPHDDDPLEVRVYLRGVEVVRRGCPAPAAGEQVDLGDVVVVAGGRLTGTVQTADGKPAAGVAVVVVPDDPADEHLHRLADAALSPSHERYSVTDAEGRFEILGLAPGTWHGLAWTEGGEHAPQLVRGTVVPVEGDAAPIAIRLPIPIVIHGVALDEDGTPLVGVEVGALRDSPVGINLMETAVTDEHGRFRLPGVSALGERVWVEIDHGDCRGQLITVGRDPLELHFGRLGHFDPDEHDRAMGR